MDSNPSSGVVQSQVHENDHEHTPNNVGSQPVAHSEENPHEMKLFMNKVKAKAKKFTDTFKKHDQTVPDDHHDLDKDEETEEDQEVHEAPIHESEVVRSATPRSGQGDNLGKSGVSFGGTTTVKGEEPHHEPRVVGVSPTTEINQQNITTDPAKTFVGEEESRQPEVYLKEEDPHASRSIPEAYTPPRHQTKVTDLTGAGTGEIVNAPVEKSFARMNVQDQDELKPSPEPKFLPNVAEPQSPPARSHNQFVPDHSSATKTQDPSAGSHDHFEPDLSAAVKTQYPSDGSHDQFALETVPTSTNSYNENSEPAEQTFNTNRTKVEEQPSYESVEKPSSQSSYTADKILSGTSAAADRAVSPEHAVDSELGYGKKSDREDKVTIHDEQKKSGDASNMSGSGAEYGKDIDHSVTEKLASLVYGKVAGVGSEVKSKLSGTGTNTAAVGTETENVVKEQNKGASVKDYLAEKLKPGEEDKALSEVISGALHKRKEEPKKVSGDEDRDVSEVISDDIHKREEETVEKEDEKSEKVSEESSVNSPGKGVVDRLKDAYGSWFGKSVENQSTPQGGEGLSKSKDSGSEVEQVSKAEGEKRLQE